MKLYTEEQLEHAIKMARSSPNIFTTPFMYDTNEIKETFTPIELPSDEEIMSQTKDFMFEKNKEVFFNGAKWMREQIQGGNK